MYYFRFKKHKEIHHQKQLYTVYEAVKHMNEAHRDQQSKEKPIKLNYEIVSDDNNGEAYIADIVKLGYEGYFDYFQYTTNRFRQIFANDEETLVELNQFIKALEKQYDEELLEKYDLSSEDSVQKENSDSIATLPEKKTVRSNVKNKKIKINTNKFKSLVPIAIAGLLMIYGVYGFINQSNLKTQATQDSNETYAEEGSHDLSEQELAVLEREYFLKGEAGIDDLSRLVDEYPDYKPAEFDLAYLEQDYQKVIEMRESADSEPRQAQLAVAYISVNQLDEATELNQKLKNPEIKQLIKNAYNEQAREALKEKEINEAKKFQEKSGDEELGEIVDLVEKLQSEINKLNESEDRDEIKEIDDRINEILESV